MILPPPPRTGQKPVFFEESGLLRYWARRPYVVHPATCCRVDQRSATHRNGYGAVDCALLTHPTKAYLSLPDEPLRGVLDLDLAQRPLDGFGRRAKCTHVERDPLKRGTFDRRKTGASCDHDGVGNHNSSSPAAPGESDRKTASPAGLLRRCWIIAGFVISTKFRRRNSSSRIRSRRKPPCGTASLSLAGSSHAAQSSLIDLIHQPLLDGPVQARSSRVILLSMLQH